MHRAPADAEPLDCGRYRPEMCPRKSTMCVGRQILVVVAESDSSHSCHAEDLYQIGFMTTLVTDLQDYCCWKPASNYVR